MSLTGGSSFFKQYAKSGYINKMNPQFQGIAKKYYNQKHQHEKVHHMKKKLDQQVAFIERMQKKMGQQLQKKKVQLKYTKQVNNRFLSDMRKREWLMEYNEQQIQNNRKKKSFIKTESLRKIQEAKFYLQEHKRSMANINRNQNKKLKQQKTVKRAKEWDSNRSRVSEIYQFKKQVKENTNKFYQSRNFSSFLNYQKRIQSYQKFANYDSEKIKELQNLKKSLGDKFNREKQEADQLNRQLERMRNQYKLENGLVKSRLNSRTSSSVSAISMKGQKHTRHKSNVNLPFHT